MLAVGEIARAPVHLQRDEPAAFAAPGHARAAARAEGPEGTGAQARIRDRPVRPRPARHQLHHSAQGAGAELGSEHAAADHQPVQQRSGKGSQIDRAASGTVERDPVEEDERLVSGRSPQGKRGRLPRTAQRVQRDSGGGAEHLCDRAHLAGELVGLDHRGLCSRRARGGRRCGHQDVYRLGLGPRLLRARVVRRGGQGQRRQGGRGEADGPPESGEGARH